MAPQLEALIQYATGGVVLASIIALAAIGLSLVYGILKLPNFAHGDLLTLGAYTVFAMNAFLDPDTAVLLARVTAGVLGAFWAADWTVWRSLHPRERGWLAAAAITLAVLSLVPDAGAALLGPRFLLGSALALVWVPLFLVALDRLVWARLRRKEATMVMVIITSIGVALVIRHALMLGFGTGLHDFDRPPRPSYVFGPVIMRSVDLWVVATAAIAILAVHVLLAYTRTGRSLRAVADDMELARVTGVDVPRMITYVWLLAGALTALAGILLALTVNVNPNVGWNLILPLFAAVILGGIGSAYGALLGALVIGMAMEVSVLWADEYRIATAFLLLLGVILVRPQGLLGVKR